MNARQAWTFWVVFAIVVLVVVGLYNYMDENRRRSGTL
jgi:hypothetical protein